MSPTIIVNNCVQYKLTIIILISSHVWTATLRAPDDPTKVLKVTPDTLSLIRTFILTSPNVESLLILLTLVMFLHQFSVIHFGTFRFASGLRTPDTKRNTS